jgi:hypothetical protein
MSGDRIFTLEDLGVIPSLNLSLRLRSTAGKVWWYPLCDAGTKSEIRREIEVRMCAQVGTEYIFPGF